MVACVLGTTGCATRDEHYRPAAGYVPDAKTAIRIAEAIWTPIFGEREIRSERPYRAELRGRVWHVYGSLPPPPPGWMHVGGVAEAEIDRYPGKILRVYHGE